mmetsp:Transcript_28294/g.51072  ORF Transcript_28294/g.51072 Transcript_28294/m.51072 type:complete len:219 (+) Transcript_28294:308-964(+)
MVRAVYARGLQKIHKSLNLKPLLELTSGDLPTFIPQVLELAVQLVHSKLLPGMITPEPGLHVFPSECSCKIWIFIKCSTVHHHLGHHALDVTLCLEGGLRELSLLPSRCRRCSLIQEYGHDHVEDSDCYQHHHKDVAQDKDSAVDFMQSLSQRSPVICRTAISEATEEGETARRHISELWQVILLCIDDVSQQYRQNVDQRKKQSNSPEKRCYTIQNP